MTEKSDNYLSLANAAKLCPYSQDYLSLRARQGKLKAIKLGRNWVTKKEWLDEYLEKMQAYHEPEKIKKEPVKKLRAKKKLSFWSPEIRFGFVLGLAFVVLLLPFLFFEEQGAFSFFSYAEQSLKLSVVAVGRIGSAFLDNSMEASIYNPSLWSSSFDVFGNYFAWLGQEISLKAEIFSLIFK